MKHANTRHHMSYHLPIQHIITLNHINTKKTHTSTTTYNLCSMLSSVVVTLLYSSSSASSAARFRIFLALDIFLMQTDRKKEDIWHDMTWHEDISDEIPHHITSSHHITESSHHPSCNKIHDVDMMKQNHIVCTCACVCVSLTHFVRGAGSSKSLSFPSI